MTNSIAICLALLIFGFLALDHFVLEWNVPVNAMKRLAQLTEWIAFWR